MLHIIFLSQNYLYFSNDGPKVKVIGLKQSLIVPKKWLNRLKPRLIKRKSQIQILRFLHRHIKKKKITY